MAETDNEHLIIYAQEPRIKNLGPGVRYGLWLQGCLFQCKGCVVPKSWKLDKGLLVSIDSLVIQICESAEIEGITISGGEPLLQVAGVVKLLSLIRSRRPSLTVVLYTGYELDEIIEQFGEVSSLLFSRLDVLVTGRFDQDNRIYDGVRGSSNQLIYFLSDRITRQHLSQWSSGDEIIVRSSEYFISGIPKS